MFQKVKRNDCKYFTEIVLPISVEKTIMNMRNAV